MAPSWQQAIFYISHNLSITLQAENVSVIESQKVVSLMVKMRKTSDAKAFFDSILIKAL